MFSSTPCFQTPSASFPPAVSTTNGMDQIPALIPHVTPSFYIIILFSIRDVSSSSSCSTLSCRFRWPRGLRRGSAAERLLGLRVRIPPRAWICFLRVLCVVRWGLCDGPITRPEESYRVWCVWVGHQNLNDKEASAHYGCQTMRENILNSNLFGKFHMFRTLIRNMNKWIWTRLMYFKCIAITDTLRPHTWPSLGW